jgi:hypothetical protein
MKNANETRQEHININTQPVGGRLRGGKTTRGDQGFDQSWAIIGDMEWDMGMEWKAGFYTSAEGCDRLPADDGRVYSEP